MKMFVLTKETSYEGGSPALVILASSRRSALKKLNATEVMEKGYGLPSPAVVITEETKIRFDLRGADGYALYEVSVL